MPNIVIYTTAWCPFCIRAKALLDRKGVAYEEIPVDGNPTLRAEMASKAGRTSVPQIWIGDKHIGGCDELHALERAGRLDPFAAGLRPAPRVREQFKRHAQLDRRLQK